MCANGRTQRIHVPIEKSSIPTVTTESVVMNSETDATQGRDVMHVDITNSFVQTKVLQGDERNIVKIRGTSVGMLLEIEPANTQRISDW